MKAEQRIRKQLGYEELQRKYCGIVFSLFAVLSE